ncbi:MAG: chromosomal replication initiator protein DnaA [Eubacteriales bacterium]|nr:chromosomal replication initiator protein DnaA [Eubacteriales bacterium]
MPTFKSIWEKALVEIKKGINDTSYNLWFSPLQPISFEGDTFTLFSPSPVNANVMSHMYMDLLKNALLIASGLELNVSVVTPEDMEDMEEIKKVQTSASTMSAASPKVVSVAKEAEEPSKIATYSMPFNPRYTFDEFIEGPNNAFAYGTALGVVNKPSAVYNPLLIYGETGLGKTHLLQAIGQELKKIHPDWRITYITSERFTTDLIEALHKKTNMFFRETYRDNVDVLLIDDIQFFAGKDRTQEEFFHTFNELINKGKTIVLTSDRPPKDIYPLEDRIRNRIEGSTMVDIKPPDYETRLAILRKKLESTEYRTDIPDDVMELIATHIKTNIRELEGAIKKLVAYKEISHKDINKEIAVSVLTDIFSDIHTTQIDAQKIIKEVEDYFNLNSDAIVSKKRNKAIVFPRQLAMFICRQLTDLSLNEMEKEFKRDHSTVHTSISKIEEEMKTNLHIQYEINELIKKIKGE